MLVIGGRSKIGLALIKSLRARGEEVRTLVRAHERRHRLAGVCGGPALVSKRD